MKEKQQKFEVINLFPTPVMLLNLPRAFTEKEIKSIHSFEKRTNVGNSVTTDYNILKTAELKSIKQFLNSSLQIYLEKIICPRYKTTLYITESWVNFTQPGGHHHIHRHQNSIVSGVLYISAEAGKDKISFSKETHQVIYIAPSEFNAWNTQSWRVGVETGQLILFPSEVAHMVEPVIGNNMRISLSFNTFVEGEIGTREDLNSLQLSRSLAYTGG